MYTVSSDKTISFKACINCHSIKILEMKVTILALTFLLFKVKSDEQCPDFCLCTEPEGNENQTGIKWMTCNIFPQQIPSSASHLTINSVSIQLLTNETLKHYTHVKHLSLQGLKIEEIQDKTFNEFQSLIKLQLSSNRLTRVNDDTFKNCSLLEELYLSLNLIQLIEANSFHHLLNLKILDLSFNSVMQLPDLLPHSLIQLDVNDNFILNLPNVSVSLPYLHQLNLCANNYTEYDANNFFIPNLNYLCLGDHVEVVNSSFLDQMHSMMHFLEIRSKFLSTDSLINFLSKMLNLQTLSLSNVTISSNIQTDFQLAQLRRLRLKNVQFVKGENENLFLFNLISDLETLELDDCPQIAQYIFSSDQILEKLETIINLKLHNVNINQLTNRQMSFLKNIKTLSLIGNPLKCDCEIEWLVHRVENNSLLVSKPEEILCSSPIKFKGSKLFSPNVTQNLCHVNRVEKINQDDHNGSDKNEENNGAGITVYHVLYVLIAMTSLLTVAFLIVIILLCKTRCKHQKKDDTRVLYRRRYSLDLIPPNDQKTDFSMQVAAPTDQIKEDIRPYSSITFHPRRERKEVHVASIEDFD